MKKLLLGLVLMSMATFCYPKTQLTLSQIYLQVKIDDPTWTNEPIRRSPVAMPSLCLNGHTLIFNTPCDNNNIRLVNKDGDVEYSILIPPGIKSVILPNFLSGEYELQIIQGQVCFYGFVELL